MNNESEIGRIVGLMQRDDSFDAPGDSILWAKNLFRSRVAEPKRSIVRTVLAVLRADLKPGLAFGERSASASAERQMLFAAGDAMVDLRLTASGKSFKVNGQVLGDGFADAKVALASSEGRSYETRTNELSEFGFGRIARGSYRLILANDTVEIVVEGLEFS